MPFCHEFCQWILLFILVIKLVLIQHSLTTCNSFIFKNSLFNYVLIIFLVPGRFQFQIRVRVRVRLWLSTVSCNNRFRKMWKRRGHVVFRVSQSHAFRTNIQHFTFRILHSAFYRDPELTGSYWWSYWWQAPLKINALAELMHYLAYFCKVPRPLCKLNQYLQYIM